MKQDRYSVGPWAAGLSVLFILGGLTTGALGFVGATVLLNVLVGICGLILLFGRNNAVPFGNSTDIFILLVSLVGFSALLYPFWNPFGMPVWSYSLFEGVLGFLMIFDIRLGETP